MDTASVGLRTTGAMPIVCVLALLGCIEDPPPSSYIEVTEVFTIRHAVVELGPLAPARVGPEIAGYDSPIAEVMPGDRLRLEAIVVDTDGLRVRDGVVAWNGRPVEGCWASRRSARVDLEDCGFVHHHVVLGPIFAVYAHAFELGLVDTSSIDYAIDLSTLPQELFEQPANRIPKTPELQIRIDGEQVASGLPPFAPLSVGPGSSIEISFAFDPLTQLFQRLFWPVGYFDFDTFEVVEEQIYSRTATTGEILQTEDFNPVRGDGRFTYVVDEFLEPGISRVWIGYEDERAGNDYLIVEFEHR